MTKGFTGPIWIILDPEWQDTPLKNGSYQILIPADGTLRVKTFQPFEQWHPLSARYDDGTPLQILKSGDPGRPTVGSLATGQNAAGLLDIVFLRSDGSFDRSGRNFGSCQIPHHAARIAGSGAVEKMILALVRKGGRLPDGGSLLTLLHPGHQIAVGTPREVLIPTIGDLNAAWFEGHSKDSVAVAAGFRSVVALTEQSCRMHAIDRSRNALGLLLAAAEG